MYIIIKVWTETRLPEIRHVCTPGRNHRRPMLTIMKHTLTIFSIALATLSCSEPEPNDYPLVPYPGEYVPVSFIMESGGTEYQVDDCNNDLGDFSAELREFVLGNFTMGDTLNSNCPLCSSYSGPYSWESRCTAGYRYKGSWTCHDKGATLFFQPESSPDSILAFKALMSPRDQVWKLRYEKGEAFIELRYQLKRN